MSGFLKKNIVVGVASTVAWYVGKMLWGLADLASPVEAALPDTLAEAMSIALYGSAVVAGVVLFVWLYYVLDRKLDEMW